MKYIIPKGWHYSLHIPKPYLGLKKEFDFEVSFGENCRYNLNGSDQSDINKLFGVSFGNHQQHSIRIGWNYDLNKEQIHLYWYIYENGVRDYGYISTVNIGEKIKCVLRLGENYFIVEAGEYDHIMKKYNYPTIKAGYYLYPYFGGNQAAPHKMAIIINQK